ncbi:MAG: hypothetical protein RLZ40_875, partial [Actinomycetota bacterium]
MPESRYPSISTREKPMTAADAANSCGRISASRRFA